jgi:hypothetical protein
MGIPTEGTIEFEGSRYECKPKECTANLLIQRAVLPYGGETMEVFASGYL